MAGVVKYVGKVAGWDGIWAGVHLEQPGWYNCYSFIYRLHAYMSLTFCYAHNSLVLGVPDVRIDQLDSIFRHVNNEIST